MSKEYITKKELCKRFFVVTTGATLCNLCHPCGISPDLYNCGGSGWNWDGYILPFSVRCGKYLYPVVVLWGYRNFPARAFDLDSDFVEGFATKARQIDIEKSPRYRARLSHLFDKFTREVRARIEGAK